MWFDRHMGRDDEHEHRTTACFLFVVVVEQLVDCLGRTGQLCGCWHQAVEQ